MTKRTRSFLSRLGTTKKSRHGVTKRLWLEALERRELMAIDVLTYQYDNASSGVNTNESSLSPGNVNATQFGKLFSTPVDGLVYSQPLLATGVSITTGAFQGAHDVLFVSTEHDSLYAIDANNGQVLWQRSLIDPANGITTLAVADVDNNGIGPEVGITSTGVIDKATNTWYVVAVTKELDGGNAHYRMRLHAVDLSTGADKFGGPTLIADTIFDGADYTYVSGPWVYGTGTGTVDGKVYFNAVRQNQRAALTLANGSIYIASAAYGTTQPYHGWLLSYSASSLALNGVFCATPNGDRGGIWMAGERISVDPQGYVYVQTGNGDFGATLDAQGFPANGNYGDSLLKIGVDNTTTAANMGQNGWGLKVVDYFTPFNQQYLDDTDSDFGSGAPLFLPPSVGSAAHPNLILTAGKEGRVYLIDRDNMGKFNPVQDNVVQTAVMFNGVFGSPTYYNGAVTFTNSYGGVLQQLTIANGAFSTTPSSNTADSYGYPGANVVVSSSGDTNGVLWALQRNTKQLKAYSANNLAAEIYNSSQATGGRDALNGVVKFTNPVVANGRVYVGATDSIVAYGLFSQSTVTPAGPTGLGAVALSNTKVSLSWTDNSNNEQGFVVSRKLADGSFADVLTVGAGVTQATIAGLAPGQSCVFKVRAINGANGSADSNQASIALPTTTPASVLDFSNGFAGAASLLAINGQGASYQGSLLRLANGQMFQASSVFALNSVAVDRFSTSFEFQANAAAALADGFTFTVQGVGPFVAGGDGGALGYAGIDHSIALTIDLYDELGQSSTDLYTGGELIGQSTVLDPSGINFHSGHAFRVNIDYDGSTLTFKITDKTTGATATVAYSNIDIPALVGGTTGYVGFTAATGVFTSTIDIANWTYQGGTASAPAAPGSVVASGGVNQISLSWAAVASATSYNVYRGTVAGGEQAVAIASGVPTTSFVDTGLPAGAIYYYRVTAVSATGEGAPSSEANARTLTPPATPTGIDAEINEANAAHLTWNQVSGASGIRIYRKDAGTGLFALVAEISGNATSYVDASVTPLVRYDYRVQAFNDAGISGYASVTVNQPVISPPPAANPPAAPGNLVATPFGTTALDLSWTQAGTDVVSYGVLRFDGTRYVVVAVLPATARSYRDTGLSPGTTYYYSVRPINSAELFADGWLTGVTAGSPPTAPANITSVAVGGSQLNISWQPTSTGADRFDIYRYNGSAYVKVGSAAGNATTYQDTGLAASTKYFYAVRCVNADGKYADGWLTATTGSAAASNPTNLIGNVKATTVSGSQVDLSWQLLSASVTSIEIYRFNGSQYAKVATLAGSATSYQDKNLSANTTYRYAVRAIVSPGVYKDTFVDGKTGAAGTVTTPSTNTPISPVSNLKATAASSSEINLTWSTATQGVEKFVIFRWTGSTYVQVGIVTGTTFSFQDKGLARNTKYNYAVRLVMPDGRYADAFNNATTLK